MCPGSCWAAALCPLPRPLRQALRGPPAPLAQEAVVCVLPAMLQSRERHPQWWDRFWLYPRLLGPQEPPEFFLLQSQWPDPQEAGQRQWPPQRPGLRGPLWGRGTPAPQRVLRDQCSPCQAGGLGSQGVGPGPLCRLLEAAPPDVLCLRQAHLHHLCVVGGLLFPFHSGRGQARVRHLWLLIHCLPERQSRLVSQPGMMPLLSQPWGERPVGVEPPQPDLLTMSPLSDLLLGFLYLKLGEEKHPHVLGCLGCSGWSWPVGCSGSWQGAGAVCQAVLWLCSQAGGLCRHNVLQATPHQTSLCLADTQGLCQVYHPQLRSRWVTRCLGCEHQMTPLLISG